MIGDRGLTMDKKAPALTLTVYYRNSIGKVTYLSQNHASTIQHIGTMYCRRILRKTGCRCLREIKAAIEMGWVYQACVKAQGMLCSYLNTIFEIFPATLLEHPTQLIGVVYSIASTVKRSRCQTLTPPVILNQWIMEGPASCVV